MASLAAIQKQIADLERQADAIRKSEVKSAIATVRQLIAQYQLTIADVGLADRGAKKGAVKAAGAVRRKPAAAKPAGVPKYRDPKSGKTWTGTGKPPKWIAGAKNRDKFLITAAPAGPAAAAPVVAVAPAKRVARKMAPQAAPAVPAVTDAAPKRRAAKKAAAPAAQPAKADNQPAKAKRVAKAVRAPKAAAAAPVAASPAAPTGN